MERRSSHRRACHFSVSGVWGWSPSSASFGVGPEGGGGAPPGLSIEISVEFSSVRMFRKICRRKCRKYSEYQFFSDIKVRSQVVRPPPAVFFVAGGAQALQGGRSPSDRPKHSTESMRNSKDLGNFVNFGLFWNFGNFVNLEILEIWRIARILIKILPLLLVAPLPKESNNSSSIL